MPGDAAMPLRPRAAFRAGALRDVVAAAPVALVAVKAVAVVGVVGAPSAPSSSGRSSSAAIASWRKQPCPRVSVSAHSRRDRRLARRQVARPAALRGVGPAFRVVTADDDHHPDRNDHDYDQRDPCLGHGSSACRFDLATIEDLARRLALGCRAARSRHNPGSHFGIPQKAAAAILDLEQVRDRRPVDDRP